MAKLRLHTLLCLLLPATLCAWAQVGEPRSEWRWGVNGGVGFNRVSFSPSVTQKWFFGPTAGLTVRYTCEKYYHLLCSIQMEANFTSTGWKEDIVLADGTYSSQTAQPQTYFRRLNYIQVPILARLALGKEHRGASGYLAVGPQLGWMISETAEHSTYWQPDDRINSRNQQYGLKVKNRFDYGITGGLGLEVGTAAGSFLIEGRYYFGLANLFGASKSDAFSRSANGTIIGKITYLLPEHKKHDK
ncbi:MAG: PorT family protein [Bacteroidaceae bacterium]|nr:PorT family protein [Bacteroidaceae bacterium]